MSELTELRTVRLGGREGSKDRQVSPKKRFGMVQKNMIGIVPYNALGTGDPLEIQQPVMGTHFGGGKSSDTNISDWLQVPFQLF